MAGGMSLTLAYLVAHAVNSLGHDTTCCPHECGPCHALQDLHDAGALTAMLRPYVVHSGGDWDWWTGSADHGWFDWDWVLAHWCDPGTCENNQEGEGG